MDSQSTRRQGVELLAPAGGPEAALAAFEYGADAVYLGLQKFSARADADNFSPEQLDQIVAFAHAQTPRRRVLVAVNTLVLDQELPGALETLGTVADIGADAVIAQDLGVARLIRAHFPSLRLHASTQLAVHSRAGVETLARLGFDRVVLARELTLEEIRDAASVPGIEIETFLHGALCYAYSGICLLSSHLIGRSGNRGSCAYPCRDDWRVDGAPATVRDGTPCPRDPSRGFAFSMKDLALAELVPELKEAGVASLKIEGRKKSPLYVATAVSYYRALLDGTLAPGERPEREADLQAVFSRPWTSLYLRSHRDKNVADPDTVGHRGVRIGAVEAVARAGTQVFVRFTTSRPLERHDGLQIEIPGLGRPFGFGVDALRLSGRGKPREVLRAEAGATVEVGLPDGYPTIPEGAPVYCSSSQGVKQRFKFERPNLGSFRTRLPLDVAAELGRERLVVRGRAVRPVRAGMPAVEASEVLEGPFEPAKDPARTAEAFRKSMEKLGESRLELRACELADPEGLFVPASRLNELRRRLAAQIESALGQQWGSHLAAAKAALPALKRPATGGAEGSAPRWSIKVDRLAHLSAFESQDWQGTAEAIVDVAHDGLEELERALAALAAEIGRERLRLALPTICRRWEHAALRKKIERLHELGFRSWEGSNLSAWSLLGIDPQAPQKSGLDLAVDWPIYVLNRAAAEQAFAMGASRVVLSPEDGLENMRALLAGIGDRATVLVYQDTPLFISESCPYATLAGGCPGPAQCRYEGAQMVSGHGSEVLVVNDRCRAITLSRRPFSLARRRRELEAAGVSSLRADFIWRPYEPAEVRRIWRALRGDGAAPDGHVGNFDRGLA